jgi:hypothetical protein
MLQNLKELHRILSKRKDTCLNPAHVYYTVQYRWVDIGTGQVPLRFVTYLSKVTKINEKSFGPLYSA